MVRDQIPALAFLSRVTPGKSLDFSVFSLSLPCEMGLLDYQPHRALGGPRGQRWEAEHHHGVLESPWSQSLATQRLDHGEGEKQEARAATVCLLQMLATPRRYLDQSFLGRKGQGAVVRLSGEGEVFARPPPSCQKRVRPSWKGAGWVEGNPPAQLSP
jgi:hypothetical protein